MKDNKYSIKGDLSVGSRNTAMKDFSVGGGVGERLYMYYPNTQYKYAVESNYIIGFGSREGTLYFKSEKEAKNYVKEKPTLRKYLGEKFDDGGGVGEIAVGNIYSKKMPYYYKGKITEYTIQPIVIDIIDDKWVYYQNYQLPSTAEKMPLFIFKQKIEEGLIKPYHIKDLHGEVTNLVDGRLDTFLHILYLNHLADYLPFTKEEFSKIKERFNDERHKVELKRGRRGFEGEYIDDITVDISRNTWTSTRFISIHKLSNTPKLNEPFNKVIVAEQDNRSNDSYFIYDSVDDFIVNHKTNMKDGGDIYADGGGVGSMAGGGAIKQNEGKLFNEKGEMLVYKKQSDTSSIYVVDVYEPRKTDVEEYSKFKYCKREKNGRECVYRLDKKALIEMIKKEKFIYSKGGGVGYNVNDVVQLKNIPENYPYEIRNGIVDNKWKIVRVSKGGRSMYSDIMEDIFGYDIELLDTKIKYKAFVYPNEIKPYIKYAKGGGVGGFDAETIKQKKSEMYIAQNTNTGQVYVGGIKSKNKLYKDEKGYYLIDGYGTFMGKKYPVKKYFTPLENAVLSDYMQERYADGGSLDEEWVVYDCDTDRVLSKHKNHRSAKQASNKYWNSGKYGCIGIERKSEWDLYHLQFETGGMTDEDYEGEDLFEHYDKLPMEVQNVLEKYSEVEEYDELNRMQMELEKFGYTFDWGLDAVPFNLRKMEMGGVADKYIRSSSYKKEMQVFHSLYESRISTQRLTQILGHEPEYPIQRVGKLTLRKVYLDSYYQLVN